MPARRRPEAPPAGRWHDIEERPGAERPYPESMTTAIHSSFPPRTDPEASSAFSRDLRVIEVRLDVVREPMGRPYGLRDRAFRAAAGHLVRVQVTA
jgi:hypothetical protein